MLSAVLAFLLAGAAQSMSLDVDEGKQACVLIEADEGNTINANYEVRKGNNGACPCRDAAPAIAVLSFVAVFIELPAASLCQL